MKPTRVFVSFDTEHDGKLYEGLMKQSTSFGFTVLAGSDTAAATDLGREKLRRRIREADQMIIICGEHTDSSTRVGEELRMAQEEQTPYFLLWGRRELMCTKPIGAKPAEGMYGWTREILQEQIALTLRRAHADTTAKTLSNKVRKEWRAGSGRG